MGRIRFEISLPEVTKDSDVEGLANELSNAVYAVAIKILERGEMAGILGGNGHHAAQHVSLFAHDEVIRRRLDGKCPPGYNEQKERIHIRVDRKACCNCRGYQSLYTSSDERNLPLYDWCHKHMCRVDHHTGLCDDFIGPV